MCAMATLPPLFPAPLHSFALMGYSPRPCIVWAWRLLPGTSVPPETPTHGRRRRHCRPEETTKGKEETTSVSKSMCRDARWFYAGPWFLPLDVTEARLSPK
jgi:hypothetical protein